MQSTSIRIAGLLLLTLSTLGCGGERDVVVTENDALPPITVAMLSGETLPLPTLVGDKPLLLWFWAPW